MGPMPICSGVTTTTHPVSWQSHYVQHLALIYLRAGYAHEFFGKDVADVLEGSVW
jgi:hypothetical protein